MKKFESIFQKYVEAFLTQYLAERIHLFRQQDATCQQILEKKRELQQQMEAYEVFWEYEELETQYILLLSEAIYKQALRDVLVFEKLYLK